MGVFLSFAMAAGLIVPMTMHSHVRLKGTEIRVSDVVDLTSLGVDQRRILADRVIARLPQGRRTIALSRSAIATLVRRSVPMLRPSPMAGEMSFTTDPVRPDVDGDCAALVRPVASGLPLALEDLIDAPCAAPPAGMLRFDRNSGALHAAADLPAGLPLGRVALSTPPAVEAGSRLTLVSAIGPVSITRDVVALQPGTDGRRIFVRDGDGQVSAVALKLEPKEHAQ